jgi:histidyl-tRNA synthetase
MGDLVISLVLEELDLIPADTKSHPAKVMVSVFSEETMLESLSLSEELRAAGMNVTCYPLADKLGKQLKYGDRTGIKIAILLGPDEIEKEEVTLKDLRTGDQKTIPRSQTVKLITQLLVNTDSS